MPKEEDIRIYFRLSKKGIWSLYIQGIDSVKGTSASTPLVAANDFANQRRARLRRKKRSTVGFIYQPCSLQRRKVETGDSGL